MTFSVSKWDQKGKIKGGGDRLEKKYIVREVNKELRDPGEYCSST